MQGARIDAKTNTWYVDSGASRHMTGERSLLEKIRPPSITGKVNFAGDECGKIVGVGDLDNGRVRFERVFLVDGLRSNLLSVSQVCDNSFLMAFDKQRCYVLKPEFVIPPEMILMSSARVDDLYVLDMKTADASTSSAQCFLTNATVQESELWHKRMGHLSFRKMNHLVHNGLVEGVNVKVFKIPDVCVACKQGKQTKKSHKSKTMHSVVKPLELLHMDLFGPVQYHSISGNVYCFVVTDEYSRFSWVMFLRHKSETFQNFSELVQLLETKYTLTVRAIRTDNGGEFWNHQMRDFCAGRGIHHQPTAPYTPQMNGVAERKNRTLVEAARSMLAASNLPVKFWDEAISNACYTLNRVTVVKRDGESSIGKTSYELLNLRKPNIAYLEPFGAPCTILRRNSDSKFASKVWHGLFLGYRTPLKRVYNLETQEVEECYEVSVQRNTAPPKGSGNPANFDIDGVFKSFENTVTLSEEEVDLHMLFERSFFNDDDPPPPPRTNNTAPSTSGSAPQLESSDSDDTEPENDNEPSTPIPPSPPSGGGDVNNLQPIVQVPEHPTVSRLQRDHPVSQILGDQNAGVQTRNQSVLLGEVVYEQRQNRKHGLEFVANACFLSQFEPMNAKEALQDSDWINAMQEELMQFEKLGVWKLATLPKGKKTLGMKWVLKNKTDAKGVVFRNKARLVVKGYQQIPGEDYTEIFAPVARLEAIRIFLANASYRKFKVYQLDIKSAFLYGEIQEEVFVDQPEGFVDTFHPDKVYKLNKALYGLHQAPKKWYETLSQYLVERGFRRGVVDHTLFVKDDDDDTLLVQVYVDDIIFGSTNPRMCSDFEAVMREKFEMSSMGEMNLFLGIQVDQLDTGIFIHQTKYVHDILSRFNMLEAKEVPTPLTEATRLSPDPEGELIDQTLYRSMIGSLMYLTASRPDVMYATCLCSRFQARPTVLHLKAVRRIMCYLKGTASLGLWYPCDDNFEFIAYSDADYGGDKRDFKSTSGGCQFLGSRLVTWQCKKQNAVSQSTCESEYISAAACCSQVIWIQQQLCDYGIYVFKTPIFIDNTAALAVTKNPVQHSKTKHIAIKFHFIRDCYEKGLIDVLYVETQFQKADLFTKPFAQPRFEFLLGLNFLQQRSSVVPEHESIG